MYSASLRASLMAVFAILLLVSLKAPLAAQIPPAGAATVLTAVGNVSIIRDETLWVVFPDQAVRVGETIVTEEDGFAELELSDGSRFQIFPNSRVVFRKNPGSLRDLVDVFLGRVKFQIQKITGGSPRYRIFTPTAVISVRGTTFDVNVDPDETTFVAVDEGVVGITHRLLPTANEITLGAGESIIVYANAPLAKAVDKTRAVRIASDLARTAASIWNRLGRSGGSSGGPPVPGGGGGGTLPGDEQAPEPPPPPPPGPQ